MDIYEQLKRDEGEVLHVYLDSLGIRTAGVGHNLEAHNINLPVGTPITQAQSDQWLQEDVSDVSVQLAINLPWTENLDDARRGVLLNMAFNMGINGLLQFHRTLTLVEDGQYVEASAAMLQSKWARQVANRAHRLADQMLSGEWV